MDGGRSAVPRRSRRRAPPGGRRVRTRLSRGHVATTAGPEQTQATAKHRRHPQQAGGVPPRQHRRRAEPHAAGSNDTGSNDTGTFAAAVGSRLRTGSVCLRRWEGLAGDGAAQYVAARRHGRRSGARLDAARPGEPHTGVHE